MTRVHHYSVTQSSFTAPKILCAPPSHSFPLTRDLFIVVIVWPLPECHVVGIEQYVAINEKLSLFFHR